MVSKASRDAGDQPDDALLPRGKRASDKTIERMRWYLYALDELAKAGETVVASHAIAKKVDVKPGLVRKDLSQFGGFGRPSQGYNIAYLRKKIEEILEVDEPKNVAWVGAGKLQQNTHLLERLSQNHCNLSVVLDSDPNIVGSQVGGYEVVDLRHAAAKAREMSIHAAVIAGSPDEAQAVTDALIAGGVRAILNMTGAIVSAPEGVAVKNFEVVSEIRLLCRQVEKEELEAD